MAILSAVVLVLLGAVLGSFGNVLVLRLPKGQSLGGRSQCDGCGRVLTVRDLIPVVAGVLQRGKARCCGAAFGWSYTLWEAVVALLFFAAWFVSPAFPEAMTLGVCLWLLTLIGRIDAATQLIPDVLNGALLLAAGVLSVLYGELPLASVLVCLAVFGGQWTLSRGRWIGSGDVVLSVGIALLLRHVELAVLMILGAYIAGALVASVLLIREKTTMQSTLAFGPFLCLSAIAASLVGERLLAVAL